MSWLKRTLITGVSAVALTLSNIAPPIAAPVIEIARQKAVDALTPGEAAAPDPNAQISVIREPAYITAMYENLKRHVTEECR